MPKDYADSLGDQQTFAGGGPRSSPKSLGDDMTLGGGGDQDGTLDDGMEIVDLSARYRVEGTLGKGGMGEVLLATDTRLDRKVAIKRMLGEASRSRTAVNRFLTEAKSIAALNHPNIVQIYDYGRANDGPFLIMEYVDGISLLDKCRGNPLPLENSIELTCQLCDGLSKAHDAGIVHRDIKPANVLLTKDGTPKLTDFGLAKVETADTGVTMAGAVLGTLDFMPPEQRRDAALTDSRSDLWSLAATLYQLVTGKSPKIIKFNDVPQALQDVLGKALEDAKEDRYQTARDFKDALRKSLRDSGPDISDLGQGQCPHCSTKNDSTRKFCRNCAKSLEVACMSCQASMPMWEEVCGSCGSKQAPLLETQRAAMQAQRLNAENLLEANDFDKALSIATTLRDETDLRLLQQKSWAEQFIKEVAEHRNQQLERMSTQLSEALRHENAFDYSSAIQTLEQVPELLRKSKIPKQSLTVYALLKRVRDKETESQRLDKMIRQRMAARQVNGLQTEVDKLLVLHPDRQDLYKLKQQLLERQAKSEATRDVAFASAQQLMAAQDYEGVLKELARINAYFTQPEITKLKEQAESKLDRLGALQKSITAAIQQKQYPGLLSKIEECLSLKSDDESMKSLREQLIARDKKQAVQINEIVVKAQSLRHSCKFDAALQLLSRIPIELQTQEVENLVDNCQSLSFERQSALTALQKGLTMGSTQDYRNSLQFGGLSDPEFLASYQACLDGMKAQREATVAAEQLLKLKKKIGVGVGVLALLLVMGGIGLWTQSLLRARALASAVQESRWDDVLEVDNRNVIALIGRANQRLVASPSDPDGALSDLEAAESVDSETAGLKELKSKAFSKRAQSHAMNGRLSEAEKDLDFAKTLGASDSVTMDARKAIGQAYLKHGDAAAVAKQTADALAYTSKAIQYDPTLQLSETLLVTVTENAVETFSRNLDQKAKEGAVASLTRLENRYPNNSQLINLRKQLGTLFLKTIAQHISAGDLERSLTELKQASAFGVEEDEVAVSISANLVTALAKQFHDDFGNQDYIKAGTTLMKISQLDPATAEKLRESLATLPKDVLTKLPPALVSTLPPAVLSTLPPLVNSSRMQLKLIPAGKFRMGEESSSMEVTLSRPFYLGVYEVTQEQYESVMGNNPSRFKGPQNPVEQVSWNDAVAFCQKLSALPGEKAAGRIYRLPTEAEWEYACRAGATTGFSFGDAENLLGEYAWYDKNSRGTTHPVGQKQPNDWGLYDMHGHVWEWCQDWYAEYQSIAVIDPGGPGRGSYRVSRGGSWSCAPARCRIGSRYPDVPEKRPNDAGFRVALSAPTE